MAIKFSQFNLRTDHTEGMYLVGYDGNQNIHITVDNLFDDFINGTENTIAMFGTDGTELADSILSQDAGATLLTVAGQLNVDAAATFDTSITVTGDSVLNGNVTLGDTSADLITQTGTLYLNGPVKDTTDTLGAADQVLLSDATGELTFTDLANLHVGGAEVVEVPVKNVQGSALAKGDPVYISGSVGASGRLEVQLADASNALKMPAVGLLKKDLANNEEGFAVVTGKLRNLITDPIDGITPTENDVIYVKPSGTSGAALTTTKPVYGNFIQNIGKVGRVSTAADGNLVVSSILRTNDIPNLTPGKIWVGSTGNTIESSSITITEATGAIQFNNYGSGTITGTPTYNLSVDGSGNVIETDAVPANIVETITTTDGTYINLTPNTATDGAVTITADLSATGTADATKYLRGDNTWSPISGIYDWNISDGTNSETIVNGDTVIFSGDTYITTSYTAGTNTLSIDHDDTARADTASSASPGYGGTFTVVDSVSTNATGHLEAINVKTVTMPSADDTNTTYDLSGYGGNNGASGIQLVGSDSTTDQVAITGAGTTLVTRSGNTITVTSNDQYTGTVTGSGVASVTGGQIPYWDATTNITGTTELNYSTNSGGSVGRVGIGNSNATAFSNSRLVVGSGGGGANMTLYGGGSNTNGIAFANGTSGNAQYRGQIRYNLQTNNLEFLTNGETFSRVYVDSAFDFNLVERSLNFRNSWPYDVGAYIDIPSNNELSIGTNGLERMRIDSSGNVGIGTTTPAQKLEVVGAAKLHGDLIFDDSYNVVGGDTLELQTGGSTKIVLDSADNAVLIDNGSGGSVSDTFKSNFDDNDFTGRVNISEYIYHLGDTDTKIGFVANDNFAITTGGVERVRVTSGGSVGIATNNPSAKLDVEGNAVLGSSGNTATGSYAVALNQNNTASSLDALATGENTTASGRQAFSGGFNTTASGDGSFAHGGSTLAQGTNSFAAGAETEAIGTGSAAFNNQTNATGINSFAIGGNTTASGEASFASGVSTLSQGIGSVSSGLSTNAAANGTHVSGVASTATGLFSSAQGDNCLAQGQASVAMGYIAEARGQFGSAAIGFNVDANGQSSLAVNQQNVAQGNNSIAGGFQTNIDSNESMGMGFHCKSQAGTKQDNQFLFGRYLNAPQSSGGQQAGQSQFVVGRHNQFNSQPHTAFTVGTGTGVGAEANSFSVQYDGNVLMHQIVNKNFTSDLAAAAGGVPIGGIYHNAGDLKIRLT